MIKHGVAPFLECSTRGFKQLSPFYARPASLKGRSIEEAFQAMKVLEDGSTGHDWRSAKGKRAVNIADCVQAYSKWWDEYILEFPHLLTVIREASGLSDLFGQSYSACCQATELWRIRNA